MSDCRIFECNNGNCLSADTTNWPNVESSMSDVECLVVKKVSLVNAENLFGQFTRSIYTSDASRLPISLHLA